MKNKKVVKNERSEIIDVPIIKLVKKEVVDKPWLLEKTLNNTDWEHHWWHKFETSEAALKEMNILAVAIMSKTGKPIPNPYFSKAKAWRLRHESTGEILELNFINNEVIIK